MSTFVVQDLGGQRTIVAARQMTIGRGRQNDLVLEAPLASRRHAWAWRQGNQEIIEDLGSTHGTWVNGQRLAGPRFLHTGDVIQMGEARLRYLADEDPSAVDTPPYGLARLGAASVYCPQCGTANEPASGYCFRCGFSLGPQPWLPVRGPGPATPGGAWQFTPAQAPRRPITPVEPPLIRPFPTMPGTAPVESRRHNYVPILALAIVTVLLLVILGILALYVLVFIN